MLAFATKGFFTSYVWNIYRHRKLFQVYVIPHFTIMYIHSKICMSYQNQVQPLYPQKKRLIMNLHTTINICFETLISMCAYKEPYVITQ